MIEETNTYRPMRPSSSRTRSSNDEPPAAMTKPDTSKTASHSVPSSAARIAAGSLRSATSWPTPGGGAELPRLSRVTSEPAARSWATSRPPTKLVPPRTRVLIGSPLPGWAHDHTARRPADQRRRVAPSPGGPDLRLRRERFAALERRLLLHRVRRRRDGLAVHGDQALRQHR